MESVQLQDNMLSQHSYCRTDATSGSKISANLAVFLLNVAHFQNTPVQLAIETIAELLCHVTQVEVVICDFVLVYMLAEIWVGGVGGTELDGLCVRHVTVSALAGRCASENTYLERTACFMFSNGQLSQFLRRRLSRTSRCETAKTDLIAILNQRCCLKGRDVL